MIYYSIELGYLFIVIKELSIINQLGLFIIISKLNREFEFRIMELKNIVKTL